MALLKELFFFAVLLMLGFSVLLPCLLLAELKKKNKDFCECIGKHAFLFSKIGMIPSAYHKI